MYSKEPKIIVQERLRISEEYARRDSEVAPDLYAPWQPGEMLMISERKRVGALMLNRAAKFPRPGDKCLEIGYGRLGWLADLISWGIRECDLHGIELDEARARVAKRALPAAELEVGDASVMPWTDSYFDFVVASTVFSSIRDTQVRQLIANEIERVLSPGGAVIIYDTAVSNPGNKNLFRIRRRDIAEMFPGYKCSYRSVTLAPPIARITAKYSWPIATLLSGVPFLRTHFLAVLVKG